MKIYINKINKYLLENYPIAWNTRVFWMLSGAIIVHVLFFLLGLVALANPAQLTDYDTLQIYFKNGMLFLGLVISLLMLVVWLVTLFRNNAFKNFYPTSSWDLFKQFLAYTVILFAISSFYYSYTLGVQVYISNVYTQERMEREHTIANDGQMFLSESLYNYTIDERVSPAPFNTLFCETRDDGDYIQYEKPYLSFLDDDYQFYSLSEVKKSANSNMKDFDSEVYDSLEQTSVRRVTNNGITTFYFKDSVVDVSSYLKKNAVFSKAVAINSTSDSDNKNVIKDTIYAGRGLQLAVPTYYNFSGLFYEKDKPDTYTNYDYTETEEYGGYSGPVDATVLKQVVRNHRLLDAKDPAIVKQLLADYLAMATTYGVSHNLNENKWLEMVYHPETGYAIKHLIKDNEYTGSNVLYDTINADKKALYINRLETNYYIEAQNLLTVFRNVEEIKTTNIFEGSIHFFMWMSFIIALLIFIFRTTGLREMLFSIVVSGVLAIVIGLFTALVAYMVSSYGNDIFYLVSYITIILWMVIFTVVLMGVRFKVKTIAAVFHNIALAFFVPWLLLIIATISMHQSDYCNTDFTNVTDDCDTLFEQLGIWTSYILFAMGLLFMLMYARLIIKWRAQPDV